MADYDISNVPRRVVYAASGVGPYAFTFEVLSSSDIAVYKGSTLLTLTTDYTVTIASNGTGSVTLVASAGTSNITIVGAKTIARTTDFTTGGDFFANTLNDELDAQTIFIQQVAETAERGLKAPVTDPTDINMTLPSRTSRANKYLAFDANGNPVIGDTAVEVAGVFAIRNEIVAVAAIDTEVVAVAGNSTNVNTVATNIANVNSVGTNIANVNSVAGNSTNINAVNSNATNINTVATNIANVNNVGGSISNVNTVAGISSNVTTVAGISSAVSTVSTNNTNVSTVATNIASVNTNSTNITAIQNASSNASAAASSASSASSSASSASTSASTATTQAGIATTKASEAAASAASVNAATIVNKDSSTGAAIIPSGTTAERPVSPVAGYLRFNTTLGKPEVYNGTLWGSVGGGATGGGSDAVFQENSLVVTASYTLSTSKSAVVVGPLSINSGVSVTIPSGQRLVIL